ncbi:DUF1592 domain-containing protein [Roseiconus nitratireducens]|uniref:DUF1592 domain-containing protein n=1 Tax=Roseiconus nitratireducens TaxID=2605748 RepID=UPI001F43A6A1|nr:DUF1592 domain-containing protein [Roseiconus nitratireducens]
MLIGPQYMLFAEDTETQSADSTAQEDHTALATWQQTGLPLMQAYCVDCHNKDFQEGGLDLSPFETLDNLSAAEVQRVLEMVQFGAMPPADYDTPEIDERKQLVSALEATLYTSTCDARPKAGKVTVRRLNRAEYNHSIRDLFGLDLRPADAFPSDEVGAGFDNNGDVLSMSPMLIEKYIDAAETVSRQVLVDPDDLPELSRDVPGDQLPIFGKPAIGRFGGRFLAPEEFAWLDLDVPYEGEYRISVRGGTTSKEQPPMHVAIYDAQGVLKAFDQLDYYGGGGSSDSCRETIELTQGSHRLYFVPTDAEADLKVGETKFQQLDALTDEIVKETKAGLGKVNKPDDQIRWQDHPYMFRSLQVSGPRKHPASAYPPAQFQICPHTPPRRDDRYQEVAETAAKNLTPLMRRVFRSPVSDQDVEPYAALVQQATKEGKSFHRGMQIAVSALLVSPRFLFRVETPPSDTEPNEFGDVPLTPHQLATRLSYFLWSSTPDETLLKLADDDQLSVEQLGRQVDRMLKDPKADALASEFASQWLGLRNLTQHEADQERFPSFDDELKSSMARETRTFFLHVLRNNLPVSEFLTADYSFLDQRLAEHYGVNYQGEGFEKVSLSTTPRRGLLAHASILTLTSTPTRTSPVLRGKWILENVLGIKPPDPPAGVPDLDETAAADDNATLREQLELHRQSSTCASCHRVMDQLGFGLDDFDAVGMFRTKDAGKPIDASGALPDGRSFNGGAELGKMLGETETDALARTLVKRMLTFALGRELTPDDRCTVDEIVAKGKQNEYRLADIVSDIATCRQFRLQTITTP